MTYSHFSRPNDWDGDTFEEDNENMAALALQSSSDDDDDKEEDEEKAVVGADEVAAVVAPPDTSAEEDDEVDELAALDRLEKELKAEEINGLSDLSEEEETI